jgi:paraquat-inducible protein B
MTDTREPEPPPQGDIPRAAVARRKRRQISLVWIVPLVAVVIGIYLVVHALRTTGPTIQIQFKTAEGIEAGKTKIKYKNVDFGTVDTITLGKDRNAVTVTAKMTRDAADLLLEDTRFWIVRPRIAGGQISGLTTLLSGSYIGMDVGKSGESQRDFVGLDTQPAVTTDEPGREFLLNASDIGSLDIGSPVFFRRFQVGEVTNITLDADGKGVTARVFVHAPYEKYITANTRFWQASGVDVSIGGDGLKISTQSLTSIIVGGIAFRAPEGQPLGEVASNDATFKLFDDENSAMKRLDDQLEKYVANFTDSIRGLTVGTQVEFRGFVVGEVRSVEMKFDREKQEVYFPVEFVLFRDVLPARIDNAERAAGATDAERLAVKSDERYRRAIVQRGLRAQLRSGNLLTGQKFLALDYFKNAPTFPANAPVRDASGTRIVPTMPGSFDELQESISHIAKEIEKIPFEQLAKDLHVTLQQLQQTLKTGDQLLGHINDDLAPQLSAALADARRTMKSAEDVLASDAPLQQDLRGTLVELNRAATSLKELTDYLQRHPESLLRGKATDRPLELQSPPSRAPAPAPAPPPPSETAK